MNLSLPDSSRLVSLGDSIRRDWDKRPKIAQGISLYHAEKVADVKQSSPGSVAIMGPSTSGKTYSVIQSFKQMAQNRVNRASDHMYVYTSVGEPDAPVDALAEAFSDHDGWFDEVLWLFPPVFGPALSDIIRRRIRSKTSDRIVKSFTHVVDSATIALFTQQNQFPVVFTGGAQKGGVYWPWREFLNTVHLMSLSNDYYCETILLFNILDEDDGKTASLAKLVAGNVDHCIVLSGTQQGQLALGSTSRHSPLRANHYVDDSATTVQLEGLASNVSLTSGGKKEITLKF
jgi:hypothetical protein